MRIVGPTPKRTEMGRYTGEHEYSNIRIFKKGPKILFVFLFVFVPFPQYEYIQIFIRRFLDNQIYLNICLQIL